MPNSSADGILKRTLLGQDLKNKIYIYIYISGSMAMNTCAAEHYEASFQSCMLVRKTNQRLHVPVLLQLQLLNHTAVVGILVWESNEWICTVQVLLGLKNLSCTWNSEVFTFQGSSEQNVSQNEVSTFQSSGIAGFHCKYHYTSHTV